MQCYLYIIYHSIRFIAYFKNFFTALRQYRGDSLTHLMLITAFAIFDPTVTGSLVKWLDP